MSISPIIDERYRLRPTDLGRGSVQVTIQNVSWQGVEQLCPLLHLREFPQKRLLLNGRQMQSLIEIVGSTQDHDWIGYTIFLQVEQKDDELTIVLHPFTAAHEQNPRRLRPRRQLREAGRTLLLVALLILIFGLVFLLDRMDSLWSLF